MIRVVWMRKVVCGQLTLKLSHWPTDFSLPTFQLDPVKLADEQTVPETFTLPWLYQMHTLMMRLPE